MIVSNVGPTCVIVAPDLVRVQPPLRQAELAVLRGLAIEDHKSIFALAASCGLGYNAAYAACYSLRTRGLVALKRNGQGLEVRSLARLVEL